MVFWRKKKNDQDQSKDKSTKDQSEDINPSSSEEAIESAVQDAPSKSLKEENIEEKLLQKPELSLEELPGQEPEIELEAPKTPKKEERNIAEETSENASQGWLSRLTKGLSKSSGKIAQGLSDIVTKKKLDQDSLDALEELLIEADLGPQTAIKIIEEFSQDRFGKEIEEEEIKEALAQSLVSILEPVAQDLVIEKPEQGPFVILVCGVNGAGKTTTIGKIAHALRKKDNLSVMIAAGDTFRAAAIEQLSEWANRAQAQIVKKDIGADAAAVAFEAYEKAVQENIDVLLIDTAGRLQNKTNLMEELGKIVRVLQKKNETLPHASLLVLDATTGQNAFSQVQHFKDIVDITGLVVTKLDGSAKAGVLVGLADSFDIAVPLIGVGEGVEDMKSFSAVSYARSLMGLEN